MVYICDNGDIFPIDEMVVMPGNRSFKYGDGLFETIRLVALEPLFFQDHFARLQRGMEALKLHFPVGIDAITLNQSIRQLAEENEMPYCRIRLMVFRKGSGLYTPDTNEAAFFIESQTVDSDVFNFKKDGLRVEIYDEIPKTASIISPYKTNNCLPYILAAIHKKEKALDECILFNQYGRVADAIYHNVFWVKDGMVYTPPLAEGGVDGVMRKQIIRILREKELPFEEKITEISDLENADEIFLTNAIQGIQYVKYFGVKSLTNTLSYQIYFALLEEMI